MNNNDELSGQNKAHLKHSHKSSKKHPHHKAHFSHKFESYLFLCVLAFCSYAVSELAIFKRFGISALIVAVILGAVIGNFAHHSVRLLKKTGSLNVCTKQILRLGIILYGFRITFSDIQSVGLNGVLLSFLIVFSTFFIGLLIGKILKIEFKESVLIASGSSICGAAAVLASESITKGGAAKVAVAVCTVVVFGTLGMFLLPFFYNLGVFGFDKLHMGYFMGATLHEVAHAVAAGAAVGDEAGGASVIIKMIRVLMLVPFLLMLSPLMLRFDKGSQKASFVSNIPWFAIGFLVATGISSLSFFNTEFSLNMIKPTIEFIDTFLLSLAMVALGVNIRKDTISKAGAKPFIMAILLCVWLVCFGAVMVKVLM